MTETVIDASVLVAALGIDSAHGLGIRNMLRRRVLMAPALIDLEVASILRRLSVSGQLSTERAGAAITDLQAMPIRRVSHEPLIRRCWELRNNLSIYDAAYVAVAELLEIPLLTADGRLGRSPGIRCEIEVVKIHSPE